RLCPRHRIARHEDQLRPGARVYGEASPNYTKAATFGGVARRMAGVLPGAKLIFVARDPVARAQSQYRHAALSGQAVPPPDALPGSPVWSHLIETSSYAAQLQPYLEHYPRERLLVLDFDELCGAPESCLARVAAHLGVADLWPGVAAANSSESLAALPPWMFRFRKTAVASALKGVLSPAMRGTLKAAVSGRVRDVPGLDARLTGLLAEGLAEDARAFRALTGM
ncbi:MAG: sulfotransferase, partial [Pseudomonadota bacterium]